MANQDLPFGLRSTGRDAHGNIISGQKKHYVVAAGDDTALYVGDPVTIIGETHDSRITTSLRDYEANKLQVVTKSSAGDGNAITGVVCGVEPLVSDLYSAGPKYRPASTLQVVQVTTNKDLVYDIQCDGSVTKDSIGLNANLIFTHAGSTATGLSGVELDTTSDVPAEDASNQLYIVDVCTDDINNRDLGSANPNLKVLINNSSFRADSALGIS